MSKQILEEVMPFTVTKQSLHECADGSKSLIVEGRLGMFDTKNANGRKYPKSLWGQIIEDKRIRETMERRSMLGELDHPKEARGTALQNVSHLILDHWMNDEDKSIYGRIEILPTPNGETVRKLFEQNVTVGISSRGNGTVKRVGSDLVVQEDFKLESYDFVANPSTHGAYPKPVQESIDEEQIEEKAIMNLDSFRLLEQRARGVIRVPVTDNDTKMLVEQESLALIVEVNKAAQALPEIGGIASSLVAKLNTKRNSLMETFPPDKDGDHDEKEKEDDEKAAAKKKKKKVDEGDFVSGDSTANEISTVWPENGWELHVPQEAKPGPGDGWFVDVNDPGVTAGLIAGVNAWPGGAMRAVEGKGNDMSRSVNEWDDDDEDDDKKKKKDDMKEEFLRGAAKYSVQLLKISEDKLPGNHPSRRIARAFLEQRKLTNQLAEQRQAENEAYQKVTQRMQEKVREAVRTGKIVVEGNDDSNEKLEFAGKVIEELKNRYKLVEMAYYAESQLRKSGLSSNKNAVKALSEVMQESPSKEAIDEVIAEHKSQPTRKTVNESVNQEVMEELPLKTSVVEGRIAKLSEDYQGASYEYSDADLADVLNESMAGSRSSR